MRTPAIALAAALAASLIPLAADAHGPTRKKVTETVEINAPPEKVWALVGNFGDMGWHPAVAKTDAKGGNEPNTATRTLTLKGGGEIKEALERYDAAGMNYFYRITDVNIDVLPVANYSATLQVKPKDGGGSVAEWRGAFYRGYMNNDPPEKYNDEAAVKAVTAVYRAGLDNLKALAEKK